MKRDYINKLNEKRAKEGKEPISVAKKGYLKTQKKQARVNNENSFSRNKSNRDELELSSIKSDNSDFVPNRREVLG